MSLPNCYRCGCQPCECEERYGPILWKCRGYVWWVVRYRAERIGRFDVEGAIQAGMLVVMEACRDGAIDADARISVGAKRRICREITNVIRHTRPAHWNPQQQIPDYGYADGRTVREYPRKPAKGKQARYRHHNMAAGLCARCGRPPERLRLCDSCREKKRKSYHACRARKLAASDN